MYMLSRAQLCKGRIQLCKLSVTLFILVFKLINFKLQLKISSKNAFKTRNINWVHSIRICANQLS